MERFYSDSTHKDWRGSATNVIISIISAILTCGKRMVVADMMLQVMKSFHWFLISTMSMAIGRPNRAANGQPGHREKNYDRCAFCCTYSKMWKVLW